MKPLTTNLALYLSILPLKWVLILKTHLQLICIHFGGSGINFQVLFFNNELNSVLTTTCHSLESFLAKAS